MRWRAPVLASLAFTGLSCKDKPAAPVAEAAPVVDARGTEAADAITEPRAHGRFGLSYAIYSAAAASDREAVAKKLKTGLEAAGWDVVQEFKTSRERPVPDWDYAKSLVGEAGVNALRGKTDVLIVHASASANAYTPLFPAAEKAIADASARLDAYVWDQRSWSLWSAADFGRQHERWDGDWPYVADSIMINVGRGSTGARLVTAGLQKFGLPELLVEATSPGNENQIGNLLNLAAQTLVERMAVPAPELNLAIDGVKNKHAREHFSSDLADGATGTISLKLHRATPGPNDPDTTIVRLTFSGDPAVQPSVREQAAISKLFGAAPDRVAPVDPDSEAWIRASKLAREDLMARKSALQKGLRPHESLHVKAPFATPDGGSEWMWIDVLEWKGNTLHGRLDNEPAMTPTLKLGQKVQVLETAVADFLLEDRSTGEKHGNYHRP